MTSIDSINCNLDFELDGKQFDSIDLKLSDNRHAFEKIPIPLAVIKNGTGPTLLLSAGNHGDEYEGQVILRRLMHELSPTDIKGRLILLPALNYPAMLDNARISPLDQGNMNRSFPGIEGGEPTSAIAHFVTSKLLPLTDVGVDLHSGGSSAYYQSCAFMCTAKNPEITKQNLSLAEAFNAPRTIVVSGQKSASGFDPAANNLGIPFISAELCGGANIDVGATAIGMRGVKNIMQYMGMIASQTALHGKTRFMNGVNGSYCLSAPFSGIFEPYRELGDEVAAGDLAGQLYATEEFERMPLELSFDRPGTIMVRRNGARVRRGSHLFMVVAEMERDDVLAIY